MYCSDDRDTGLILVLCHCTHDTKIVANGGFYPCFLVDLLAIPRTDFLLYHYRLAHNANPCQYVAYFTNLRRYQLAARRI
jgi:hypothetical protein